MTDKKKPQVGGYMVLLSEPLDGELAMKIRESLLYTKFVMQVRPIVEGAETRVARNEIKAAQNSGIILPPGVEQ